MAYIATGGTPDAEDITVPNLPFFPDVTTNQFRELMRVDQTVPQPRIERYLVTAMAYVNGELFDYQVTKTGEGFASLSDVPQDTYGSTKILEHEYRMAVYNKAKAELVENYRDFDSTRSGHDRADEMETRVDEYLGTCREHIRKILSVPRSTVELI